MTQLLVSYCGILTLIVFSIGPSYWPDHGHSGGQQNTRSNHQHQGHSPAWWDQHWIVHWIPYSRKLSREKTFANWWKNQKNRFSQRKLSRIARLCRAKDATPPNFAEKTFTNSHKTAKFTKVWKFPAIQYALSTKTIFINTVMYCVLRVCVCVCVCVCIQVMHMCVLHDYLPCLSAGNFTILSLRWCNASICSFVPYIQGKNGNEWHLLTSAENFDSVRRRNRRTCWKLYVISFLSHCN